MLPSQFADTKGNHNGIGLLFFGITVAALLYGIYESHKNIEALTKEDTQTRHDIDELRMNLKNVMGNKYKPLS